MSNIVEEYNELVQKQREKVIKMRTIHEQQVAQWWQNMKGIDPMYFDTLELPQSVSLKEMVPEIYKDHPNKEVYLKQMAELNALFDRCNQLGERYKAETEKCMQELQALISSET